MAAAPGLRWPHRPLERPTPPPTPRRRHRASRRAQLRCDLAQLGGAAREWGGATVDAVKAVVYAAGWVIARFILLAAVIGFVTLIMSAGR